MQGFLHSVWPPEMPFLPAEGNRGEKKKKKKKSATPLGIPSEDGMPQQLDSRLLCNARGASRLAIRYYILRRTLELSLQGQPRSNVMVQL